MPMWKNRPCPCNNPIQTRCSKEKDDYSKDGDSQQQNDNGAENDAGDIQPQPGHAAANRRHAVVLGADRNSVTVLASRETSAGGLTA